MAKPIVVGSTYFLDSAVRFKIFLSIAGTGITGQGPFVTIVRDADNFAVDFITDTFEPTTPATIGDSQFRDVMSELGGGSYFYDFDPSLFATVEPGTYTVLFINTTPGLEASSQFEFYYAGTFADERKFGFLDRALNVCLNEDVTIAYKALPGQTNVLLNMYDPFDQLIVANATMTELNSTGIYRFNFNFTLAGDYIVLGSETTADSSDAIMVTAGGSAQRLKTIESLLAQVLQNPPSVGPCQGGKG